MMWTRPRRRCRRVTSLTTFTLGPVESRLRSCWLSRRVGSSGACAPRYTAETGMRVAANRWQRSSADVVFPEPSGPTRTTRWPDGRTQPRTRSAAAPMRLPSQRRSVPGRRKLARRAEEVGRDGRAALPAHREREAEVGREPADDPVRQREVVGVHDEVDVLAEVLRPALVVAEHGVADALLVVGGEQRAEEAARERAVPAGEGVGAGGGRHARWRHRILLTASTTSWRF